MSGDEQNNVTTTTTTTATTEITLQFIKTSGQEITTARERIGGIRP